jgi:hypothetical protein
MENALRKYSSDVYVDTTNRNYSIGGVEAIQVTGTVKPDKKRAITVFSSNAVTCEVVLENNEDASYSQNLPLFKTIVESFVFKN